MHGVPSDWHFPERRWVEHPVVEVPILAPGTARGAVERLQEGTAARHDASGDAAEEHALVGQEVLGVDRHQRVLAVPVLALLAGALGMV